LGSRSNRIAESQEPDIGQMIDAGRLERLLLVHVPFGHGKHAQTPLSELPRTSHQRSALGRVEGDGRSPDDGTVTTARQEDLRGSLDAQPGPLRTNAPNGVVAAHSVEGQLGLPTPRSGIGGGNL